jgi:hypothetical protein
MPTQAQELMRDNENLLQICLDVHMAARGSSDPLAPDIWERYGMVLFAARDNWQPSQVFAAQFDDAVLALVRAAIDEWQIASEVRACV